MVTFMIMITFMFTSGQSADCPKDTSNGLSADCPKDKQKKPSPGFLRERVRFQY